MEGRITAQDYIIPDGWSCDEDGGWVQEDGESDNWRDLENRAKVGKIPQNLWTNSKDIWNIGDSTTNLPGYIGAWIDVKQLLELFPEPHLTVHNVSARQYGETLLVDDEANGQRVRPTPSRRGRAKKGDGMVELAVQAEFARRAKAGENPDKQEAVIQDCIDWVCVNLKQTISRTSAQRYLKPILSELKPDQN